ncbi:hypothetical protein [Streptomyces smaragdinus]|uniref:hypothetical protein n=1 Tax=Streptomyces smaragdinus TaxID=2585196 RepID=UPI001294F93D|nr:hypothetical protein [Streptomyces smaragdinus]
MEILGNEPPQRFFSPRRPPRPPRWLMVLAPAVALLGVAWMTVTDPALDVAESASRPAARPSPSPSPTPTGPPRLLRGTDDGSPTGLRLLIGDTLYDVDTRTSRTVRGLPTRRTLSWATAVGDDAVIATNAGGDAIEDIRVYVLRPGEDQVRLLFKGGFPTPAADGVWIKRWYSEARCELRKLGLDGRRLTRPRPVDCSVEVFAQTPLGFVGWQNQPDGNTDGSILVDPRDFSVLRRSHGQFTVVGRTLFTVERNRLYADEPGRPRRSLGRLPAAPDAMLPQVKGSPDGSRLAFEFDRAPSDGGYQNMDFWVYERASRRWLHMPSTPVSVQLKTSDWAWTDDGRIVVAGVFDGVGVRLAVWRPGERDIEVRRLGSPPEGSGGLVPLKDGGGAGPTIP